MRERIAHRLSRFARDESGAVTVEALLWLPLFFGLLLMITDVSLAFYAKAQAYRVIESGNRAYSVDRFSSTTQAQDWILSSVQGFSPNASVTTVEADGLVSSTVVMPSSDLILFDLLEMFGDFNITVRAQQYVE